MKRKIFEYAIALSAIVLLGLVVTMVLGHFANTAPQVGEVYIKNSETQITPVSNEIYVTEDKEIIEKKRLVPEEIISSLPRIKLDDALVANYENGSENGDFFFTIYRENLDIYAEKQSAFTLPKEPGEYVVCIELYWGGEKNNIGMEYYFILEVEA